MRDYVRRIRPPKRPVYLKLHFAPECAPVDWGVHGALVVGNSRRRLSFFVMVLAFSRRMFVEFTVSQTMEHFLACHEHAFTAVGGVPAKIVPDFVHGSKIYLRRTSLCGRCEPYSGFPRADRGHGAT